MTVSDILFEIALYVICLSICLACIFIGWFLIWKCFLKRFKFVQELLDNDEEKYKKDHLFEKAFQHNKPIEEILRERSSAKDKEDKSAEPTGEVQSEKAGESEEEQPSTLEFSSVSEEGDQEIEADTEELIETPIIETVRVQEIAIDRSAIVSKQNSINQQIPVVQAVQEIQIQDPQKEEPEVQDIEKEEDNPTDSSSDSSTDLGSDSERLDIVSSLSDKENLKNLRSYSEDLSEETYFKTEVNRRPSNTELESSVRLRKSKVEKKNDWKWRSGL